MGLFSVFVGIGWLYFGAYIAIYGLEVIQFGLKGFSNEER
jgi:hypothetical protein